MPTLKFVVIPTKNTYAEYSEEIVLKIKDINNCDAELDNNYNEIFLNNLGREGHIYLFFNII